MLGRCCCECLFVVMRSTLRLYAVWNRLAARWRATSPQLSDFSLDAPTFEELLIKLTRELPAVAIPARFVPADASEIELTVNGLLRCTIALKSHRLSWGMTEEDLRTAWTSSPHEI
jgi:hypothetical protein